MRNVFRQQHYNTMLAGSIPPYYTDPEESHADPDLIYVASLKAAPWMPAAMTAA